MCFEKAPELLLFGFCEFVGLNKFKIKNVVRFATQEISEATSHTGAKVEANGAKNSRDAAGHVFATMLANAFDHRNRTAVAHSKALTGLPGDK